MEATLAVRVVATGSTPLSVRVFVTAVATTRCPSVCDWAGVGGTPGGILLLLWELERLGLNWRGQATRGRWWAADPEPSPCITGVLSGVCPGALTRSTRNLL